MSAPPPAIEPLIWDSEFFGVRIARLHADRVRAAAAAIVAAADAEGIQCLYLLLPAAETARITEAEELGFRLYDVRVELERALDGRERAPRGVRAARDGDRAALERIARTRFHGTRFFADPHFPHKRSAELYVARLARARATAPARATLVTAAADGFVIVGLGREGDIGTIELIAVDAHSIGRGAGSALIAAANAASAGAGLRAVRVVTQGANVAAQRLYQRHGFRTVATDLWLHRWRSG